MNDGSAVPVMEAGVTERLRVVQENPHGFSLTNGIGRVLLPFPEALGRQLKAGDTVDAFLYHDSEDRLTATLRLPLVQYGELARLKVADVHPKLGCFLEIGLPRHVLLPVGEQPKEEKYRPIVGDEVYVVLDRDKSGRLLARAAKEEVLGKRAVRAPGDWRNRTVDAWVYHTLRTGTFVICDAGVLGFGVIGYIPEHERSRTLRVGEKVQARVTFVREDGHVNLSLRQRKEVGRLEDSDRLLAFLRERPNGAMPYSDETQADIISQRFGISKSAFKRALGKLMKEGLVEQRGSWTHLTEQGSSAAAVASSEEDLPT